ncbi:MAG TPA: bifunctional riboflavin kinase/FAD synthetase [Acidimicrobiales bacterium]|nr:bifunctional riboflavin kinase/FAD synthetase [Acidimicrobiales bacterium]
MIVVHDADARIDETPSVVTIGVFDGLHRGHQRVIDQVIERARAHGALASVVTFDPHPAAVLDPEHAPLLLGTLDQRLEGLEALGIDRVRILDFDHRASHEHAEQFVERVLVGELGALDVVVGQDFRFGEGRAGDVELLAREGERWGFSVAASVLFGDGQRWSSTAVRRALAEGDVERAGVILGRAFVLRGEVIHGDARGSDLGFPTANVAAVARQQLPLTGIYAGAARLPDGRWWPAAISVGTRPQFYDDGALLVEVHVVGYGGDLYGASLDVAFLSRLRGEEVFADVAALVAQIERDVVASVGVFASFSPTASALLG